MQLMEGNLRGARSSLVQPIEDLKSLRKPIDPSLANASFSGRHMYPSLSMQPSKNPRRRMLPIKTSSSYHLRGSSDASFDSPLSGYAPENARVARSSSALGSIGRNDSPSSPFGFRPGSIREVRSQDNMRLPHLARRSSVEKRSPQEPPQYPPPPRPQFPPRD